MKKLISSFAASCLVASVITYCKPADAGNTAAYIVGQDGAFLGVVSSNQVDQNSICNQVGSYGSQVMQTSIRDQVGPYGSQISNLSAYNSNAGNPPLVMRNGQFIGILTKNRQIQGGTDPDLFLYQVCGQ